mmetsp:Transcript_37129/g.115342  ORF Transcript_37129/g.115342 Transcript_37129/m.115342 type:complete len:256 (+) Transcript_37129:1055-1822(+)
MLQTPTAPQRRLQRRIFSRCRWSSLPCSAFSRWPSSWTSLPKAGRSSFAIHWSGGCRLTPGTCSPPLASRPAPGRGHARLASTTCCVSSRIVGKSKVMVLERARPVKALFTWLRNSMLMRLSRPASMNGVSISICKPMLSDTRPCSMSVTSAGSRPLGFSATDAAGAWAASACSPSASPSSSCRCGAAASAEGPPSAPWRSCCTAAASSSSPRACASPCASLSRVVASSVLPWAVSTCAFVAMAWPSPSRWPCSR